MKKSILTIFAIIILTSYTFSEQHNHKHLKVTDPVCKRVIESAHTKYKTFHEGDQYWFCSKECFRSFMKKPAVYANIAKAEALSKAGKNSEAVELITKALESVGSDSVASGEYHFMLGYLKSRTGKAEETVKHWEKVLKEFPVKTKNSYITINCATIYLKYLNNPAKAAAMLEQGLDKKIINSDSHIKAALMILKASYEKMGNKSKAASVEAKLKKVK